MLSNDILLEKRKFDQLTVTKIEYGELLGFKSNGG